MRLCQRQYIAQMLLLKFHMQTSHFMDLEDLASGSCASDLTGGRNDDVDDGCVRSHRMECHMLRGAIQTSEHDSNVDV